jgi:hypothetical protein
MELLNSKEYANPSVTQGLLPDARRGALFSSSSPPPTASCRNGQNGDRREQRTGTGPKRAKPIIHATGHNQLWSWDITMLHSPGKHTYRLDAILDVFSRKVVGHRIEHTETAALAVALINGAVTQNRQRAAILHADNGAPCGPAAPSSLPSPWVSHCPFPARGSPTTTPTQNPCSKPCNTTWTFPADSKTSSTPASTSRLPRGLRRQPPSQRPELLHSGHRPRRPSRPGTPTLPSNPQRLPRPASSPLPKQTHAPTAPPPTPASTTKPTSCHKQLDSFRFSSRKGNETD